MMVALKEKNLPGAPLAARSSLLWAQNFVDQDWEDWNSNHTKWCVTYLHFIQDFRLADNAKKDDSEYWNFSTTTVLFKKEALL